MTLLTPNFALWLRQQYDHRVCKNQYYSLRAFARDLNVSASHLSEVLKGTKGFAPSRSENLAQVLGLSAAEKESVHLCLEQNYARSLKKRAAAAHKSKVSQQAALPRKQRELEEATLRIISGWEHFAILELLLKKDVIFTSTYISNALNLNSDRIESALSHLLTAKLIRKSSAGSWSRTSTDLSTSINIPSASIREHQSQLLQKAQEALDFTPIPLRDFGTMTMCIDPTLLPEAQRRVQEFRRSLCEFLESGHRTEVYCFASQLFPVTHVRGHP